MTTFVTFLNKSFKPDSFGVVSWFQMNHQFANSDINQLINTKYRSITDCIVSKSWLGSNLCSHLLFLYFCSWVIAASCSLLSFHCHRFPQWLPHWASFFPSQVSFSGDYAKLANRHQQEGMTTVILDSGSVERGLRDLISLPACWSWFNPCPALNSQLGHW